MSEWSTLSPWISQTLSAVFEDPMEWNALPNTAKTTILSNPLYRSTNNGDDEMVSVEAKAALLCSATTLRDEWKNRFISQLEPLKHKAVPPHIGFNLPSGHSVVPQHVHPHDFLHDYVLSNAVSNNRLIAQQQLGGSTSSVPTVDNTSILPIRIGRFSVLRSLRDRFRFFGRTRFQPKSSLNAYVASRMP
eukprot:PhF_6_TR11279/c0_g1_i2/m.18203